MENVITTSEGKRYQIKFNTTMYTESFVMKVDDSKGDPYKDLDDIENEMIRLLLKNPTVAVTRNGHEENSAVLSSYIIQRSIMAIEEIK